MVFFFILIYKTAVDYARERNHLQIIDLQSQRIIEVKTNKNNNIAFSTFESIL